MQLPRQTAHRKRDTLEYNMITSGVKHNNLNECFNVANAWVDDPAKIHNNEAEAGDQLQPEVHVQGAQPVY